MARAELTPQDLLVRKQISANLNRYLSEKGISQTDLGEHTHIPKSTISGYVNGTSTPTPGNVQKIADYFGVPKSAIDPRFAKADPNEASLSRPMVEKIARKASQLSDSKLDMLNKVMDSIFSDQFGDKKDDEK